MKQKIVDNWNLFKSKFQKEKSNKTIEQKNNEKRYKFELTEPYYCMVNGKVARILWVNTSTLTLTKVNDKWLCYCPFYDNRYQGLTGSAGIFLPIQITDEEINKITKGDKTVEIMTNEYSNECFKNINYVK